MIPPNPKKIYLFRNVNHADQHSYWLYENPDNHDCIEFHNVETLKEAYKMVLHLLQCEKFENDGLNLGCPQCEKIIEIMPEIEKLLGIT